MVDVRPLNILLVDDSPSDAEVFEAVVSEAAAQAVVTWVDAVEEARRALDRGSDVANPKPIDLVILDLNLPREDGFQLLKFLRETPALASVIVVVMSSSTRAEDVRRSYELGARSYIRKPLSLNGLETVVQNLMTYWQQTVELPVRGEERKAPWDWRLM